MGVSFLVEIYMKDIIIKCRSRQEKGGENVKIRIFTTTKTFGKNELEEEVNRFMETVEVINVLQSESVIDDDIWSLTLTVLYKD